MPPGTPGPVQPPVPPQSAVQQPVAQVEVAPISTTPQAAQGQVVEDTSSASPESAETAVEAEPEAPISPEDQLILRLFRDRRIKERLMNIPAQLGLYSLTLPTFIEHLTSIMNVEDKKELEKAVNHYDAMRDHWEIIANTMPRKIEGISSGVKRMNDVYLTDSVNELGSLVQSLYRTPAVHDAMTDSELRVIGALVGARVVFDRKNGGYMIDQRRGTDGFIKMISIRGDGIDKAISSAIQHAPDAIDRDNTTDRIQFNITQYVNRKVQECVTLTDLYFLVTSIYDLLNGYDEYMKKLLPESLFDRVKDLQMLLNELTRYNKVTDLQRVREAMAATNGDKTLTIKVRGENDEIKEYVIDLQIPEFLGMKDAVIRLIDSQVRILRRASLY